MKTASLLTLLLLVGVLGSSCVTVSRLNAEYEEEQARVAQMSPEEKAEFEKAQQINWNEYLDGGGGDED